MRAKAKIERGFKRAIGAKIEKGQLLLGDGRAISVEGALSAARGFRKSAYTGPNSAEEAVDVLLFLVEALQQEARVADAARAVHEALKSDETLLEAVDAAYRLGGAEAVRDLILGQRPRGG